ncbi:MAG: septal ring lytic transglycosylase RlpA family protein, partial [Alphaproteobacteria bacterium]|nr:septal ring lytic transglycosylase RlpA family protein [Alphaproteobacteria bacterium]
MINHQFYPKSSLTSPLVRWSGLALVGLMLSGCAGGSRSTMSGRDVLITGPSDGSYKVGKPYQIQGNWYYPAEDWSYAEEGVASWYGPGFNRKKTANGETYDQSKLSAAHRTLPMPCFVRVTNLNNGRSIVVRINDRGPFARDRILDLSMRGAQLLGYDKIGTASVKVEILTNESKQLAREMLQRQKAEAEQNNNRNDVASYAEQLASLGEIDASMDRRQLLADEIFSAELHGPE